MFELIKKVPIPTAGVALGMAALGNLLAPYVPVAHGLCGVLSLGLVYWLHPALSPWLARVPAPVSWMALATLFADLVLTAACLRRSGDISALRWHIRYKAAGQLTGGFLAYSS